MISVRRLGSALLPKRDRCHVSSVLGTAGSGPTAVLVALVAEDSGRMRRFGPR
jgi:hypothetical protein